MANLTFWRLPRKVATEDFWLVFLLVLSSGIGDASAWTSFAAWLGSGLAGLAAVLFWGFASTRRQSDESRRYYASIFVMEAVAVLAMTGVGCGFVQWGYFPRVSAALIGVGAYVALCAFIYFAPPPPGLERPESGGDRPVTPLA